MRVLYIVYWGAAEPLGQSLVLPAVLRMAEAGVRFTLVTFEKPADLADRGRIEGIRAQLSAAGAEWIPLRYHKRPKWPATLWDVMAGGFQGLRSRLTKLVDVVHARTFVGGAMGLLASRLAGAPLVYHNEGFYPDEQVDGRVWAAGSLPHRIARQLERRLYSVSDGVIALSHRARAEIEAMSEVRRYGTPTIVVPSAVDLDRFRMRPDLAPAEPPPLRLVYIGSVGLRYIVDRVARFVSVLASRVPVSLTVLSPASDELVASMMERGGLDRGSWSHRSIPHTAMPDELPRHHAGLFFLTQGKSEHGCSPTKIGEYWASGLPVITTANVSDTDEIVSRERVGVIVRGHEDEDYRRAADELIALLAEPGLSERCRQAAERHYSLSAACDRQVALYRAVSRPGPSAPGES